MTVTPYIGPHLDVGSDFIFFKIDNMGGVEVIGFEHIKDFELTLKIGKVWGKLT
ncbi:DUF3888 domain-containing protein [Paenibacillus guangzhouensis]|uniref:DUF3888 domain-containing protein n=1 Tax=Paenibacillus guangzhouensis TaxID=1473112 RepID=UPI00187BB99D